MDSEAVRYTFEEASHKFGFSYVVYKRFQSVDFLFDNNRDRKSLGLKEKKELKLQPTLAVKAILSDTYNIEDDSNIVAVYSDRSEAISEALSLSNHAFKTFAESEQKWLKQLRSYAVTTLGGLCLFKSYRNAWKEVKDNLNRLSELTKKNGENNFFTLEDVLVDEPETIIVYNDYHGKFHYFDAGYEHNKNPQYAELSFKKVGYKLIDGKYYPHYKLRSYCDYNDFNKEHEGLLSRFGITYCYDDHYNGHKNSDDVLFTFNDRSKVYKTKEALQADIDRFSDQTIKRLEHFSNISTRL